MLVAQLGYGRPSNFIDLEAVFNFDKDAFAELNTASYLKRNVKSVVNFDFSGVYYRFFL